MRILHHHQHPVAQVTFSPNGLLMASVAVSEPLRLWRTSDHWQSTSYSSEDNRQGDHGFTCVAFDSGPLIFAVGRLDGAVDVCSTHGPSRIVHLPRVRDTFLVTSLTFLNRGRYLAICVGEADNSHGTARIVDCQKNYATVRELAAGSYMCGVAAQPSTKTCFYIEGMRRIKKCNLLKSDQMHSTVFARSVRYLSLNHNASLLAVAHDYAIDILDAETLQRQKTLSGHKGRVDSLAFLPDGRLLSGSWDKTVRLWDIDSGRQLSAHDWDVGGIRSVAVSPDGLLAAAGGDSGAIVLWDLDE